MESVGISQIRFDADGLVPAVIQDFHSGEVLMVAYMNRESLTRTAETGETWFYSRSRRKLWHKGEESGHFQHVKRIYADCDEDTLVIQVVPDGPACHTNHRTCFFRSLTEWENAEDEGCLSVLHILYNEIRERKQDPRPRSYTNYLLREGKIKLIKKSGKKHRKLSLRTSTETEKRLPRNPATFCTTCLSSGKMPESISIRLWRKWKTATESKTIKKKSDIRIKPFRSAMKKLFSM